MNKTTTSILRLLVSLYFLIGLPSYSVAVERYALLVGVSSYPSLPSRLQLQGPKNDVQLVRQLLLQRGFALQDIHVIADQVAGAANPTRAAILTALQGIAAKARDGDFVVLFLAGLGSQQPARNPGLPNPDSGGLDKIFLPRDVGSWDPKTNSVHNAITDDELGERIDAIRNRGAFVWLIVDASYLGAVQNAFSDDLVRYRDVVPGDLGIPSAVIRKSAIDATKLPARRSPQAAEATSAAQYPRRGGLVVFYSSQHGQRAPEEVLPAGRADGHTLGVFTFALSQVLFSNPSITYREAGNRILHYYHSKFQIDPKPIFEGSGLDAHIPASRGSLEAGQWELQKTSTGLQILAGVAHQISVGSVLEVISHPSGRERRGKGFVRVTRTGLHESNVVPVMHLGHPAISAEEISFPAYVRLVEANIDLALRVALPPLTDASFDDEVKVATLLAQLQKQQPTGLNILWNSATRGGDVRMLVQDKRLWFLPSSGEIVKEGPLTSLSINLDRDPDGLREAVLDVLRSIAKTVNLGRIGFLTSPGVLSQKVEFGITLTRDGRSIQIPTSQVPTFRERDRLQLVVKNRHSRPMDITILFIDSGYRITRIFPSIAENNRVVPNGLIAMSVEVNTDTVGYEGLLFIATEAAPSSPPVDFGFLAQHRVIGRGQTTKLQELLLQIFVPEKNRFLPTPVTVLESTAFRLFTWKTVYESRDITAVLAEQGRSDDAQRMLGAVKEEELRELTRTGPPTSGSVEQAVDRAGRYLHVHARLTAIVAEADAIRGKLKAGTASSAERVRLDKLEIDLSVARREFDGFVENLVKELAASDSARAAEIGGRNLNQLSAFQGTLEGLGHGAVRLDYILGSNKLSILLTTPKLQIARQVDISSAALNEKVTRFRKLLENPKSNPVPAARELYTLLIEPVAAILQKINAQTLMISLDGKLRYVPFSALHDGNGFMLERYRVVMFTEAAKDKLKDLPNPKWRLAALGVTRRVGDFEPLPGVRSELEGIVGTKARRGVFPGEMYLDEFFTANVMREVLLKGYPVVHVASHFVFQSGTDAANSFLLLGDGKRLTLTDFNHGPFDFRYVDLIALSACETALGNGKELEGFAAIVQRRGAKSVLATLWRVADESTAMLMQNMYRIRADIPGMTKAEALRQAQLALVRGDQGGSKRLVTRSLVSATHSSDTSVAQSGRGDPAKRYAHPFYWAPFVLMGNWL